MVGGGTPKPDDAPEVAARPKVLTAPCGEAMGAADLGTFVLELASERVFWDERACRVFGVEPVPGYRTLEQAMSVIHPCDLPLVRRAFEASISEGSAGVYAEDKRVAHGDGWRWVATRARVSFRTRGGQRVPERMVGVVEDITARKTQELAAAREARMIALSHDAITAWELLSGRIHAWSRGACELYGHGRIHALGRDRRALVPSAWEVDWDEIVDALRRTGRWHGEGRHQTRDGETRIVDTRMQLLVDDAVGTLVLEVSRDVTAERAARRALEQANRNKDDFLAMMGHELRRPLAALAHAAALQAESPPDDPIRERAGDVMRRQTAQMERLLEDLLDLTRVARGKVRIRRRPVALGAFLREVTEDHRVAMRASDVRLDVEIHDDATIDADPTRLAQVVGNLLSNAAKFTPAGGRVAVRLAREAERAVITVEDDGEGMDAATLVDLFEPFRQAVDGARGGLGLGLSLVRSLTELHDGTVEAASDGRGRGARFTLRFPLAGRARPPTPSSPPAAPLRILLVDDDRDAAELLELRLRRRGHRVTVVHDAAAARERAATGEIDVVLTDLDLGGGETGFDLARRLRAERRGLRVAAVSGAARRSNPALAEAGFDACFGKPVPLDSLLAWLGAPIDGR